MAQFRRQVNKDVEKLEGITQAARAHRVSRQSVHRWIVRYDGTLESLMDRSRRPRPHPVTTARWKEATAPTRRGSTATEPSSHWAISKTSLLDTLGSPTGSLSWFTPSALLSKSSITTRRWCNTRLTNLERMAGCEHNSIMLPSVCSGVVRTDGSNYAKAQISSLHVSAGA